MPYSYDLRDPSPPPIPPIPSSTTLHLEKTPNNHHQAVATSAAQAPLVGPTVVKALQVLPPIACQAAFLAPLDAMKTIKQKGTTGDLPLVPYASMMLNGVLWIT